VDIKIISNFENSPLLLHCLNKELKDQSRHQGKILATEEFRFVFSSTTLFNFDFKLPVLFYNHNI